MDFSSGHGSIRFIRRTLLCLIVGVTVFGVSGWLLRPRPSWEVEIPTDAAFVYSANSIADREVDQRTILQSWPLPLRDPKWPSAAIAVVSAIGIWLLCARRAAKRKNLADV